MNRRLRFQVPVFVITGLVMDSGVRMIYPFLGAFSRGLGVDITALTLALSWRSLAGISGSLLASTADNLGRRMVMLFGVFLFITGVTIVVLWPTYPVFVLSIVLTSTGSAIFSPVLQAYLGDRVVFSRRGLVLALFETRWSLSAVIGLPLLGFIITRGGWLAPFPLLIILGIMVFFFLLLALPRDRSPLSNSASIRDNFGLVFSSKAALAGLAITMLPMSAHELISIVFGIWLEDAFGLKIAAMGAAAVVIGVAELSGQGLVIRVNNHHRAVKLGLYMICLTMLLMPVLGKSLPGALASLFLFYIVLEFTFVNVLPLLTEILPSARATLMALAISSEFLGRAIIAPLAPYLYGIGLWAVSFVSILLCILGLVALNWVKIYPKQGDSNE